MTDKMPKVDLLYHLPLRPFVKSVLFGALAGATPVLFVTIPLAIALLFNDTKHLGLVSLWIAALPLIGSIPIVTLAMVMFGLPLTFLLRWQRLESASAYFMVGAILGALLPIAFLLLIKAPAQSGIMLLGAISGGVTGITWWLSARKSEVSCSE